MDADSELHTGSLVGDSEKTRCDYYDRGRSDSADGILCQETVKDKGDFHQLGCRRDFTIKDSCVDRAVCRLVFGAVGGYAEGIPQGYLLWCVMIFASLGTMDMPFVRMAKAVDEFAATCGDEVVVQTGFTDYTYQHAVSFRFCTKDEMQRYIAEASILILQGGWGAISEAMEQHKRIVVIPRHDKTEHIHDQFQLVRKLDALGCVIGVFDENGLPQAVEKARTFGFQRLKKGNAENLIRKNIQQWFG